MMAMIQDVLCRSRIVLKLLSELGEHVTIIVLSMSEITTTLKDFLQKSKTYIYIYDINICGSCLCTLSASITLPFLVCEPI